VIISVSSTVLPTPAPPNRPALPPRSSGISTSMILMPVSKTQTWWNAVPATAAPDARSAIRHRQRRLAVDGVAEDIEHARENSLAHRRLQRPRCPPPPCRERGPGWASGQCRARGAHPAAPSTSMTDLHIHFPVRFHETMRSLPPTNWRSPTLLMFRRGLEVMSLMSFSSWIRFFRLFLGDG
jgi:hypothetical protein